MSAIRWGFLYQGQRYAWQKQRRGTPALDLRAQNFVLYLENHDQVANAGGARLASMVAPGDLRAMTALMLLAPATPMLFQGQEIRLDASVSLLRRSSARRWPRRSPPAGASS